MAAAGTKVRIGTEGRWAVLRDWAQAPFGELLEVGALAKQATAQGGPLSKEAIRTMLPRLVLSWNLIDTNGAPLPPPAEDPDAIFRAPAADARALARALGAHVAHFRAEFRLGGLRHG